MQSGNDEFGKFLNGLGSNIARIRKAKGLTLSQLAYESGTEKANIVRIEQSQTNPTIKTLWKIAKALDVEPHEFFLDSR